MVRLRQTPDLPLLLVEPGEDVCDGQLAVGANEGHQPVEEVLAEGVRHLQTRD